MKQLEEISQAFLALAPECRFNIFSIDYFKKLNAKLGEVETKYFSMHLSHSHPLEKIPLEDTFIGIGGAYRSKKELDGFYGANAHISQLVSSGNPFTENDLLLVNRLLMTLPDHHNYELYNDKPSEIRRIVTHELIYTGANPDGFPQGIACILTVINNPPALHPLLIAALVHYLLVYLHPFKNGNGRTARLLGTYVMKKHGYDLMHPVLEEYYAWNTRRYEQALHFSGHFYDEGVGLSRVHDWSAYFLHSIFNAYKDMFSIKFACKITQYKVRLLGRDLKLATPISPVPPGVKFKVPPKLVRRYGQVGGAWAYHDADGNIIAWRVRFNGTAKGNYVKSFLFLQYCSNKSWQPNHLQYFAALPMYGLHKLRAAEGKTIILCEGEKSADAVEMMGILWRKEAIHRLFAK
jgi:hypothetical protein